HQGRGPHVGAAGEPAGAHHRRRARARAQGAGGRPPPGRPAAGVVSAMSTRVVDVEGRRLILTHLDEVLWPEDNVTKDELLAYYTAVADRLLPFIANRPLSLQRAPDAITGECAFQKTAPPGMPSWVPTR